ncbi:class I SAM-dependent methyltransferase [Streptomonospora litoralis]|uniref:Glycine/sarcosine N-methyltransferase n=1 Tax=Streptomonospora litoralis TaxID=2498135 RepID=A0A4P6Q1G6_9ACTN|nr:class I SAM-dependent methyltransferase [Streptomonospora litoralis]QBI53071.1 Glycine/sarcosine N-methyltransferase [Streptomonospora litoralis]
MQQGHESSYGRMFAGHYDKVRPRDAEAEATAAMLADLAPKHGKILEFGVGTGRIAVPLARIAGPVTGVDSSPEMIDVLHRDEHDGASDVFTVCSDMRGYDDGERYALVYCVAGTLSALDTPEEQQKTVFEWAGLVADGGTLVIEMQNPEAIERMHGGRMVDTVFKARPDSDSGVLVSRALAPDHSVWEISSAYFENGSVRVTQEKCHLAPPERFDAPAAQAGLELADRFGDWQGGPLNAGCGTYISVYRRSRSPHS